MKGSEILVRMLQAHDVECVFGLPGDTSMSFYDALKSSSIRHIMARDERSAGYMADAYARLSGKPGVTEAPSGGGATYLFAAASEADGSSIPLVALTSDVPLSSDNRYALTAMDQVGTYKTATRFSTRITRPEFIPHSVRYAFRAATSGRMGAAHLSLPEDVLSDEAESADDIHPAPECSTYPAWRIRGDAGAIEKAAELLRNAERPVILCGGGTLLSGAQQPLAELAELIGAGVVTTIDGKGSIAEVHPNALGVVGANGAKASSNGAIMQSDVVLAVGSRLDSTSTWGGELFAHGPALIHVDVDPLQLGNNRPTDVTIQADARLALVDLCLCLEDTRTATESGEWVASFRKRVEVEIKEAAAASSDTPGIMHPCEIVKTMTEVLPDDAVIIADAGTPTPYLMAYYPTRRAGKWVYASRTHGSLGYAVPAALGAREARPDSPIIAVTGDGSLGMSMGELEAMARQGNRIIVMHLRNDTFGWIKMLQKLYYQERYFSVDFDESTDYVGAARSMGASATLARSADHLRRALDEGLQSGISFIEMPVAPETELTPPVASWLRDERLSDDERRRTSY